MPRQWANNAERAAEENRRKKALAIIKQHLSITNDMIKIVMRELRAARSAGSVSAADVRNLMESASIALASHKQVLADIEQLSQPV